MKREQEDVELAAPDNLRRCDGMSALMTLGTCGLESDVERYAAHGGYPQCCMHLLAAKADPNGEDEARRHYISDSCNVLGAEDGMRPLHFAAANGSLSVCELLLQPPTQLSSSSGQCAEESCRCWGNLANFILFSLHRARRA